MTLLINRWIYGRNYNMLNINQIVNGTIKNLLNKDEALYLQRIAICHKCKLLKKDKIFGEVCNSQLYLNPKTNEVSKEPKPGFANGCGCIMNSKARVEQAHCPLVK